MAIITSTTNSRDGRINAGILGELYAGVAQAKAIHSLNVGPIIYTMNALGGTGLRDNFLGPRSDGTGSVTSILVQYDYSFGTLARYLSRYPKAYWADGPELRLSLFGTYSKVKSDDFDFDGTSKSKFGGELVYSPLPFLSIAGRFDRVNPTNKDTAQSFSVISPRIMLRTDFFSHDVVTIQYSRYMYGGAYPRMASCGSERDPGCIGGDALLSPTGGVLAGKTINDLYGKTLDPLATGRSDYYDKDVIYVSASMWW